MNVDYVLEKLVAEETKEVEGIEFHIKRFLKKGFIFKEIRFNDKNENFFFTERVKAITLTDFKNYFKKANIELLDILGDYQLQRFDTKTSPRLILIFK